MATYKEHPLELVTLQKGIFQVGAEALNILSSIKEEIAVIAVAGLYRTGKSFILNRLLDRQDGFDVGPTINPCTKGIYTWGKPILFTKENGKKICAVLIDTEGIGSTQQDAGYDAKIFSLAVLLSSYFVYNSMGTIDERAIENLSLIANLSKSMTEKEFQKHGGDLDTISEYFPRFLWLVRDFGLKLQDESGASISSKEYLENALKEKSGDRQKEKNEVRKAIKQFFNNRDCVTLVRPVVDEDKLQAIDKIGFNQLREEFRNQVVSLKKKIFGEVQPKKVMGHALNGRAFVSLLKNFVDAINNGGVPAIHTAFHAVAMIENQQAYEAAARLFSESMQAAASSDKLPIDESILVQAHSNAAQAAIDGFKKAAIGDDISGFLSKLTALAQQELSKFKDKNLAATKDHASKLVLELVNPLHDQMRLGKFRNINALMQAWADMQVEYSKRARGTIHAVVDALNSAVPNHLHKLVVQFTAALQQEAQAKLDEQHKKEEELNRKIVDARKEVEAEKDKAHRHEVEITRATEQLKQVSKEHASLQTELRKANEAKLKLEADLAAKKEELIKCENELATEKLSRGAAQKDLDSLSKTISKLEVENSRLSASYAEAEKGRVKLEAQVALLEERGTSQKTLFDGSTKAFKERIATLEKDIKSAQEAMASRDSSNKAIHERAEMEAKKAHDLSKALSESQQTIAQLTKQVNSLVAEVASKDKAIAEAEKQSKKEIGDIAKTKLQQAGELQRLTAEAQELSSDRNALKKENAALKKDVQDAGKERDQLRRELDSINQRLQQELEETRQIVAALEKELADAKKSVAQAASPMQVSIEENSGADEGNEEPAPKARPAARAKAKVTSAKVASKASAAEIAPAPAKAAPKASASAKATSAKGKEKAVDSDDESDPPQRKQRGKRKRDEGGDVMDVDEVSPPKRGKMDPAQMTKPQLKSELTKLGVHIPPKDQPKNVYVQLYNDYFNK